MLKPIFVNLMVEIFRQNIFERVHCVDQNALGILCMLLSIRTCLYVEINGQKITSSPTLSAYSLGEVAACPGGVPNITSAGRRASRPNMRLYE